MGHSHGGAKESARVHARARMLLFVLVVPLLTATALGLVILWPADANPPTPDFMGGPAKLADAKVVKVDRRVCSGAPEDPFAGADQVFCQKASVKLTAGAGGETGKVVDIEVSQGAD